MVDLAEAVLAAGVGLLLGGFAYASVSDLRRREVADGLWQALGVAGFVLGAVAMVPGGALPVALWVVVGALTLEHMFGWDELLGSRGEAYADLIELIAYVVVGAAVGLAVVQVGVGGTHQVPVAVVAVLVTIVFARVLFEAGVLYGGADAKALMIAGLLVPLFPSPLLLGSATPLSVPSFLPFPVDLLMNAALLSVAVPVGVAIRNVARGDFRLAGGFTGFYLPVRDLPHRFVWVRDPSVPSLAEREEAVETSDEDRALREELARELTARGVARVWVTPQLPFLVLMALGAVSALLAGNLVVDLIRLV